MCDNTYYLFDIICSFLQLLALVVGGSWAYFRFRLEEPDKPRIEFDVDCQFLGPILGNFIAAFEIHAENKGHVEHKFSKIVIRVRGIRVGEPLAEWEKRAPRLSFPHELVRDVNLVPTDDEYNFVRPGVSQRFTFTTKIPADIRFIVAHATFEYERSEDEHTAERVFELPTTT